MVRPSAITYHVGRAAYWIVCALCWLAVAGFAAWVLNLLGVPAALER